MWKVQKLFNRILSPIGDCEAGCVRLLGCWEHDFVLVHTYVIFISFNLQRLWKQKKKY